MKKETIADKMAKAAFQSPAIQKSWQGHVQAFGPILEPAFSEDYQSRVHLTAALNSISTNQLQRGIEKLASLKEKCVCDADKAALLFFFGVCYEMAGAREQMLTMYIEAGKYEHRFYLPYLKVAKAAHEDAAFDTALAHYERAISCLEEAKEAMNRVLAAAKINMASCLTMMHRYDEAHAALDEAEAIMPGLDGALSVRAICCAAAGEKERALACMDAIERKLPEAQDVAEKVCEILEGKNPHFAAVAVEPGRIDAFWRWFEGEEERLRAMWKQEEREKLAELIAAQLTQLFPFMERTLDVGVAEENGRFTLILADCYAAALKEGYAALLAACPAGACAHWSFEIER